MTTVFRNIDPQGDLQHPILGIVEAQALVEVTDPHLASLMAEQVGVWSWESGSEPAVPTELPIDPTLAPESE
jgi:hypothetical protein